MWTAVNGSGLLVLALLGQLIVIGDGFSIPHPACTAAQGRGGVWPARFHLRNPTGMVGRSSQRNAALPPPGAPRMTLNSPTHYFPSLLEDPLAVLRSVRLPFAPGPPPSVVSRPADFTAEGVAVEEEAAADDEKFHAAELSSKLTLDFYFRNLQRSARSGSEGGSVGVGNSGMRFDEISRYSPWETLHQFAEERDIALDEDQVPAAMYDSIVAALQGGKRAIKTEPCRRIERFVEYGKLRPMPNRDASQPEGEDIRAVLAAYGAQDEGSMHFSIEAVLRLMEVPFHTDYTVHNGEMYIDLILEGQGRSGGKFLLTTRDRKSFDEKTNEVSSYCKMKAKSVRGIGYSVVAVPYFEWDKLDTNGEKVAYLAGRLSRAGFFGEGGGLTGESASRVKDVIRKSH
uniref:RAP domain-containing protein n=1 Tax=Hemiselmis tepida TaxID=464990 RepID=A0A7S0VG30_9CRYP|mmetsp:Transcript_18241/g.46069  ORF Transcript_18241/g.46069 Transcript_18241/m.46069 type:complete len:400 (+) Transcript_18241:219-1418(+)